MQFQQPIPIECPNQEEAIRAWRKLKLSQLIQRLDFLLSITPEQYIQCLEEQFGEAVASCYNREQQLEIEKYSTTLQERLEAYINYIENEEL